MSCVVLHNLAIHYLSHLVYHSPSLYSRHTGFLRHLREVLSLGLLHLLLCLPGMLFLQHPYGQVPYCLQVFAQVSASSEISPDHPLKLQPLPLVLPILPSPPLSLLYSLALITLIYYTIIIVSPPPLDCKCHKDRDFCLFCSPMYLQQLDYCLHIAGT